MPLSQSLQHSFIALAATDLLPAPPVKSGFIAVDSRHSYLLPLRVDCLVNAAGIPLCADGKTTRMRERYEWTSTAFPGIFSIAKAERAVKVSSRSRSLVYAPFADIAQFYRFYALWSFRANAGGAGPA